ncbi:MAG: nuclear transport factor 2 family protein [Leptolyngbyaceae bacterium]|nr:nuclear transport factor 2 family protein [Leptolyngbyaceae bacterium]
MNVVAMAIALAWADPARADLQPPATAPEELTQLLDEIDAAANARDIERVMEFVSDDFVHADGLDSDSLEEATQAFWNRFDALNYQTDLIGWEQDGDEWTVQTLTTVSGLDVIGNRSGRLRATVESEQRFENGLLVEQTILSEESQLTLGETPPVVDVNLAEQVGVGSSFSFDAIVLEPLGDRLLLGTAFDEPVDVNGYLNSSVITLDLLSAGGLFKVGVAPAEVGDRWISAVLVRDDGITALTRRLQVVPPGAVPDNQ